MNLPDKWRAEFATETSDRLLDPDYLLLRSLAIRHAAELEAETPVWTQITDDPNTWPEDVNKYFLWFFVENGLRTRKVTNVATAKFLHSDQHLLSWRPLGPNDTPPETNDE